MITIVIDSCAKCPLKEVKKEIEDDTIHCFLNPSIDVKPYLEETRNSDFPENCVLIKNSNIMMEVAPRKNSNSI